LAAEVASPESRPRGGDSPIERAARPRPWRELAALAATLALASLLTMGYLRTGIQVTVTIDGHPRQFRTHQTSVGALLEEIGLEVHPQDIVSPGLEAPLRDGDVISVRRARPVVVEADGRTIKVRTQSRTVAELLQEVGVALKPHDLVILDGQEVSPQARLADDNPQAEDAPPRIVVRRAVPIHVEDGGAPLTIYTTQATVGEALRAAGIVLYLGDRVNPDLASRVSAGLRVYIERSRPVTIRVDGRTIKTRTQGETVAEVLAQEGVALLGKDYTEPALGAPVADDMVIRVVRVREEVAIEQEPIPFETVWRPDPELELDHRRLDQEGRDGVTKRRFRVVYEDGQEVGRTLEDEWVALEPVTKTIAYGTKVVLRELKTPEGTFKYWRKIRVLATSYTAATCGKSPDHPRYGLTFLGWRAGKGIVAVDPAVINLGTKLYVPGYGLGVAGDTGGKIRGRHIDLGYDEGNLRLWNQWVDVYLLAPPPPAHRIRWILPNWPKERR